MKNKICIILLALFVLTVGSMAINAVENNGQGNGPCDNPPCRQQANAIDLYVGGATQGSNEDNVTVFVNVTDAQNITNLQFNLLYNKSVLNATEVNNGSTVNSDFDSVINNSEGMVTINVACESHPCNPKGNPNDIVRVEGTGTIAIINFTVIGNAGDTSYLNISEATAKDDTKPKDVELNVSNSTFNVIGAVHVLGAPMITHFSPGNLIVNDTTGSSRTFSVNINQTVNLTWYINHSTKLQIDTDVNKSSYDNASASEGMWRITAVARNDNGNDSHTWIWNVTSEAESTPTVTETAVVEPTVTETAVIEPTPTVTETAVIEPTPTVTETAVIEPTATQTASKSPPEITEWDPDGHNVTTGTGVSRTFSVEVNQIVKAEWYINKTVGSLPVKIEYNVTKSTYTRDFDTQGKRRITVVVINDNGTDEKDWSWYVIDQVTPTSTATPIPTQSPTSTPTCLIPEGCDAVVVPTPAETVVPTPTETVTPTPTSPTSNSGNSVHGGSGEGFDNSKIIGDPDIFEERILDLSHGIPTIYSFTANEFAIYEMSVVDRENEYKVAIRVTKVKDSSKFTNAEVSQIVYANESVTSESQRLSDILIRFRVNNSWIDSNSIDRSKIVLYKLDNGSWKTLETTMKSKDDRYTYFESSDRSVARWQLFTIGGVVSAKEQVAPLPVTTVNVPPQEPPLETKSPNIWPVLLILVVLLMLGAGYYKSKNRNPQK